MLCVLRVVLILFLYAKKIAYVFVVVGPVFRLFNLFFI